MKKALFLILALGLFSNCLAQDLLITAKGKLIRCKILAQTDQLIFISKVQPDGSSISSYISKDTIRLITPSYSQEMGTLANKTAIPQINDPIQNGKHPKNRRPFSEVARFALSVGYSHLFDSSDKSDIVLNGKGGIIINGDIGGFFNETADQRRVRRNGKPGVVAAFPEFFRRSAMGSDPVDCGHAAVKRRLNDLRRREFPFHHHGHHT